MVGVQPSLRVLGFRTRSLGCHAWVLDGPGSTGGEWIRMGVVRGST